MSNNTTQQNESVDTPKGFTAVITLEEGADINNPEVITGDLENLVAPDEFDVKKATLEEIIAEYKGASHLVHHSDNMSLEVTLNRLEELTTNADIKPIGEVYKDSERLKGIFRYQLAMQSEGDSPVEFSSFEDLQARLKMKYQFEPTIEQYIEQSASASPLHYNGEVLIGANFKERGWLLEPLIKEESSAMLYADAGVGKTWFTWTLVVAIAGGGEIFGWKAEKPRRVWVIDGEMHYGELVERLHTVLKNFPTDVQARALKNIRVTPRQAQHWTTKFYDLDDGEYQKMVLKSIQEGREESNPIELVVLDNFSCIANVEDENSSSAFNGICEFLNRAKTMTTVLLIHHTNKNSGKGNSAGMSYRGSSKLGGIMEACIALKAANYGDLPEGHKGAAFTLELEKFRALRDDSTNPRTFSLNSETGLWNTPVESSDDAQNKYVTALKTGNYTSAADIGKALGKDRSVVTRSLQKAIADGVISKSQRDLYYEASDYTPEEGEDEGDF